MDAAAFTPDWNELGHDLGILVAEQVKPILERASKEGSDLAKRFGLQVGKHLVMAIRSGRDDLKAEVYAQIRILAELLRVELQPFEWDALEKVLATIFRAAAAALKQVFLPGLPTLGGAA